MNGLVSGFFVDASEALGLGHLSRCRALGAELLRKGWESPLFHMARPDLGREFLAGSSGEVIDTREWSEPRSMTLVVMDIPDLDVHEQRRMGAMGRLSVVIDDEGSGPFDCDILIRPNLLQRRPPTLPGSADFWEGGAYVILGAAYSNMRNRVRPDEGRRRVLVCFGGSDPADLTGRLVRAFADARFDADIHFVVGPAYSRLYELRKVLAPLEFATLDINLPHLADAFREADVAIVSGGTVLYEACASGVPAIVVCQNAAQDEEAIAIARKGAAENLGLHTVFTESELIMRVERLLSSPRRRGELARAGRRLVSGDGARRIVEKIEERLLRSPATTPERLERPS